MARVGGGRKAVRAGGGERKFIREGRKEGRRIKKHTALQCCASVESLLRSYVCDATLITNSSKYLNECVHKPMQRYYNLHNLFMKARKLPICLLHQEDEHPDFTV
jgi:hypothetical protein